jgi:hypothetical protein
MNEKALGVLFFFAPLLLIPLYKRHSRPLVWAMFTVLLIARRILPCAGAADRVARS